jgi:type I restriction enzyme S subunit
MSSEWIQTSVGEFCPFIYGKSLPERTRVPGAYPVVSSAGITGSHNTPLTNCGGIVIGRKGTVGSVTLCEKPFWPIDTAYYVVDEPNKRDLHFTYYLLSSIGLSGMNTDSAVPGLNRDNAHAVLMKVPSLSVQKQISAVLRALDNRIALLREANTTLEAIAQALFKSWFVDFDPVHANAGNQVPSLPPEVQALFPSRFVESSQGLIPEGWQNSTISQSFILTMGQSPPGDTYNEEENGLPFYQGKTDFGFRFPNKRVYCNAPTRLARRGHCLVSVRAPVGDVNVAIEDCAIGRGVAGVSHPDNCNSFALYTVKSLRNHFENYNGEGTVFGSINKKDFENLPVIQPPAVIVAEFQKIASNVDAKIENNELMLRNLSELRDTILPRLISGKLRLPEIEEELERTL